MDPNEIMRIIRSGEGETIEFKSDNHSVAETVCAMANTHGGSILIGIADDGTIKGVSKKDEERVSTALKSLLPSPKMSMDKVCIEGRSILVISVEPMTHLVSLGPLAYIRVGRGNRPLSITELVQRSVQLGHLQFDSCPSGAPVDEMAGDLLAEYLKARKQNRGIARKGSLLENARRLKVIVKDGPDVQLSYGGLLCFSKRPQDHLASADIRIIYVDDDGATVTIKEFDGPVWLMAQKALTHLVKGFKALEMRVGAARRRILEFPEWSVREAIINAIAHRNYALDADIRIFVHPDKLVIRSPGGFPQGVTPEHPEHRPVNPLICQYLYDFGLVERYGYGITNMQTEVGHHPFCKLTFDIVPSRVDVVFTKVLKKGIDEIDQKIIAILKENPMGSTNISGFVGLSKVSVVNRLKRLESIGLVKRIGKGPTTVYTIAQE